MKFSVETLTTKFFCSELNIKLYKELLKCSFGDEPDKDIFVETLSDILSCLLKKSPEDIKQMSVVDILLILLQLRINSQGDSIKLSVSKDGKRMGLELDLNLVKQSIIALYKPYALKTLTDNNIDLYFSIPSVKRLLTLDHEDYLYFLSHVKIKNKQVKINTNSEAVELFDRLPPKLSLQFIEYFNDFTKEVTNVNFLERYQIEQILQFVPSIDSLIWYTKFLFSEPLDVFYDNLFYLSHLGHLNLTYIDQLSPGEYIYMVKKLEHTLNQKSSNSSENEESQDVSDENFDDSGMFGNEP